MRGATALLAGLAALAACVREGAPSWSLQSPTEASGAARGTQGAWDALWGQPAAPVDPQATGSPDPARWPRLSATDIPSGTACLQELSRLNIDYRPIDALKGVQTPVHLAGAIGPITLRAGAGLPLTADCRLAVALAWSAPRLAELGVTRLTFSGAYVDRLTRAGRPSLHARGLAVDVHSFTIGGAEIRVKDGFARDLADLCAPDAPSLNRVVCGLRQLGLYKELLTPDYNADHRDHFHLGVAPLPGEPFVTAAHDGPASPPARQAADPGVPSPAAVAVPRHRPQRGAHPSPPPKREAHANAASKRDAPGKAAPKSVEPTGGDAAPAEPGGKAEQKAGSAAEAKARVAAPGAPKGKPALAELPKGKADPAEAPGGEAGGAEAPTAEAKSRPGRNSPRAGTRTHPATRSRHAPRKTHAPLGGSGGGAPHAKPSSK